MGVQCTDEYMYMLRYTLETAANIAAHNVMGNTLPGNLDHMMNPDAGI